MTAMEPAPTVPSSTKRHARRRFWLVAGVLLALVPAVATFPPLPVWFIGTNLAVRSIGNVGWNFNPVGTALLAVPQVAVFAYSIARIIHPPTSASARQPTPSASR